MISLGRRIAFAAALALAVLGGARAAEAKMLATGLMLSSNADLIDCFVSNVGTSIVPIASAKVFNYQGNQIAGSDGCTGASLLPGKSCTVSVSAQAGRFRVQYTAAGRAIRAQCQFTTEQNNILATMEAR